MRSRSFHLGQIEAQFQSRRPLAFVLWIAIITFELIEGQWQLWTHEKEQPIMLAQMNALEKELEARSKTLKAR